jgi:hypothetical protein
MTNLTTQDKEAMKKLVYVKFVCDPYFGADLHKGVTSFLIRNFPQYKETELQAVVNEMPLELDMIRRFLNKSE